ncbi:MAG TPA: hypothetical protein PLR25_00580 [Planctomycetaceae bacterium]|nr:hypothetical protein [Planctomycetaceae bacterium]
MGKFEQCSGGTLFLDGFTVDRIVESGH